MKKIAFISLLNLVLSIWTIINAQTSSTITVTGSPKWIADVPTLTIAGSDYQGNLTSSPTQTYLNIVAGSEPWSVSISKREGNQDWPNLLKLYAKRTGNGIGSSTSSTTLGIGGLIVVSNNINPKIEDVIGSGFILVENVSKPFLKGTANYTNIPIQYEIRGLSVLIPAGNYSTTVYYTISDN